MRLPWRRTVPASATLTEGPRLRDELDVYTHEHVDDRTTLVCRSAASCRGSVGRATLVEGQASFVGSHYGLTQAGRELRILVVPQQVGGALAHGRDRGDEHVTVGERAAQVETSKYGQRPYPRTAHMVGTEHALQVLLGMAADGDPEIDVTGGRVHVFEAMAMANATLCSRVLSDAAGQGSATMIKNCERHLKRTAELLRPNVILAQGYGKSGPSPSRAVASMLGLGLPQKTSLTIAPAAWGEVAFVAATHPSRNWAAHTSAKWRELEPVLRATRAHVLGAHG